jgi:hypothetical protein
MTASANRKEGIFSKPMGFNRAVFAAVVVGFLVCAASGWCFHWLFFAGVNPGPTLIQELRTGAITASDMKAIDILKFDAGGGWPFSEREYTRKARKRLAPESANGLLDILRTATTDGNKARNHPASFYYGILRIELVAGGHYYVFYELGYDRGEYFTYVDANARNSTNPNGATHYENVPLAQFLKQDDPWFRDMDSPPSLYRPSCPDDIP